MSAPAPIAPEAARDVVIDVHGLTKSFGGRVVVRDLSMQVGRGTIFGFLGPNGSGKTTTIRMLCGLLTPDQGSGTCLGFDIRTEAAKIKTRVGYMTQHFSLYQDLSVRENLEFVARIYGLPRPARAAKAMIARLGLEGREEQIAGKLSGGWKQRLALGACTLPNPQLLLLDEPTAGVDPKARRDFWTEIHDLAAGGTVSEVIENAHLTTFTVDAADGESLAPLARELATRAGVDTVAPFGASLHVSGRDGAALEAAIASYQTRPGLHWQRSSASLEDVFIALMAEARDNFE